MSTTVANLPFEIKGLRNVHGRGMNNSSDVYKLPADEGEMNRLSTQHHVWCLIQGGLYPPEADQAVQRLLAPRDDGSQPAVLDVGSGPGSWAVDMALAFPHVKVLGLDLAESKPAHAPPNCSFATRDVMKGLDNYAGQFDVVHSRSVGGHVTDIERLVRIIGSVVKPGGIFFFLDGVINAYNGARQPLLPAPIASPPLPDSTPADESHSWFARWFVEVTDRMACHGQEHVGGDYVGWHLRHDGQFDSDSIVEKAYWTPLGWSGEPAVEGVDEWAGRGQEVGDLMAKNIVAFIEAGKPVLLSDGLPADVVNSWAANAEAEIEDPSKKLYMKWGLAWATKLPPGTLTELNLTQE